MSDNDCTPECKLEKDAMRAREEALVMLFEGKPTYKDLELSIKNGTLDIRAVVDPDGDQGGANRVLVALLLNFLLGDDGEYPPNYLSWEGEITLAESCQKVRFCIEVIKPGGRSSHQIRQDLEAAIVELQDRIDDPA
jgi:hypothetical protein